MPRTFALSCHAAYRCRERGVCCTSGWPIDVSPDERGRITDGIGTGRVDIGRAVPFDDASTPRVTLALAGRACVFHRTASPDARCAIHHALGHGALPLACRQFPRVTIEEPRGHVVTLSHYCPTAETLLSDDAPVRVVGDAPAFPPGGEYIGLAAAAGLPPALRPDMLTDWVSWWHLEEQAVAIVDRAASSAEALSRLGGLVDVVRAWQLGDGPLDQCIDRAVRTAPASSRRAPDEAALVSIVASAIPESLRPTTLGPQRRPTGVRDDVRRRYLTAHVFANWTAHLGEGLRTWYWSILAADALIARGWSIADADLWLRHLVDPGALAAALAGAEQG